MISLAEYRVISLSTSVLPLYSYSNQNHCGGYVNTTKLSFQPKWGICLYSLISNTKKKYYSLKHESCIWLMHLWPREENNKSTFRFCSLLELRGLFWDSLIIWSLSSKGLKARLFLFTYMKFVLFICTSSEPVTSSISSICINLNHFRVNVLHV